MGGITELDAPIGPVAHACLIKDMESAPKDGSHILVYGLCDGEVDGKYPDPCWVVVAWSLGKWMATVGDCYGTTVDAECWVPLPEPPSGDR